MAEESGDLLVTPERTKPNEGNPRRSSMGKASPLNSGEKVLPHYLRASTGSCHDLCKYGRKHTSEAKERRPLQKRITKSTPDNQSPTVTVIVPERKKTSVVKPNPSPEHSSEGKEIRTIQKGITKSAPDNQSPTVTVIVPARKKMSVVKPNPSPISKSSFDILEAEIIKREVSSKSPDNQNVKASPGGRNPVESEVWSRMNKISAAKLRTSPKSKIHLSESPKFKTQEVSSSSEKVHASSRRVSTKSKETNASAKNVTPMKLKSPVKKPFPLPDHSGSLSRGRNSDISSGQKMGHPKIAVKQASTSSRLSLASPRASSSPIPSIVRVASLKSRKYKSLKVVSPLKNQGKVKKAETEQSKNGQKQADNDSVHEKTLYVIKMETENKSLESDQNASCADESSPSPSSLLPKCIATSPSSLLPKCIPTSPSSSSLQNEEDQEHSEYTETEAEDDYLSESEYEESMTVEGEESSDGQHHGKPNKHGMVHSEDKDSQAMKLHFRRGKIVDIQSESNSPRRLKFRQGRVLGQNQILKADGRRRLKKRGADDEMNDSKPGSEKVVLRHQDVQGKKDSQVLFNNVIEQTASKLVETRKSKVKALVGAFETVISLQDGKPA